MDDSRSVPASHCEGQGTTYPCVISAHEFCSSLIAVCSDWERGPQGERPDTRRKRTTLMVGNAETRRKRDHGLLGRAAQKIKPRPLVRAEEYRIDQVWWYFCECQPEDGGVRATSNVKEIGGSSEPDWWNTFWYAAAAIEHENDPSGKKFLYNLRKSFVFRALLKVFVTYPPEGERQTTLLDEANTAMGLHAPDAMTSQYLVCFGPEALDTLAPESWNFHLWDPIVGGWKELRPDATLIDDV